MKKLTGLLTGEQIKKLREGWGMTQRQFAGFLNIPQPRVARWESGTVQPSRLWSEKIRELQASEHRLDMLTIALRQLKREGYTTFTIAIETAPPDVVALRGNEMRIICLGSKPRRKLSVPCELWKRDEDDNIIIEKL